MRLSATRSLIAVIDIQEKLLPVMPNKTDFLASCQLLLQGAKLLNIPILATEQYPQGLGPTIPEIHPYILQPIAAKKCFSSFGSPEFRSQVEQSAASEIILAGMETHICVRQSALDFLNAGYRVWVARDAVQARHNGDHDSALQELAHQGVFITTVEAILFDWLESAENPQFKAISHLVRQRSRSEPVSKP